MREREIKNTEWIVVNKPGYLGKNKDETYKSWNRSFGEGNWRIAWQLANGKVLDYPNVFWKVYVPGYAKHFLENPQEAVFLVSNYSYAYDKDLIGRDEAFDPMALYEKPGRPNQFHNVALNIALEWFLGMPFRGERLIQVREGKPGTPVEQQPEGYLWSPGRIATTRADLIPSDGEDGWWGKGSIEELYQKAKVLQVKR